MRIRHSLRFASLLTGAVLSLLFAAASALGANPFARGVDRPVWVFNIAHAGASSVAPQNTLAAGRAALDFGADVWSIDVRQTSDGVFVLMHDETLERTTDVAERFPTRAPWRVDAFAFDEMRTLDAGSWFVRDDPFSQIEDGLVQAADLERFVGEPIPTLREALEFVAESQWLIDIEVKPTAGRDPEQLARQLINLIEETGTAERAMISSFDHDILRAVKRIDETVPIGALVVFPPRDPLAYLDDLRADVYLPSLVGFTDVLLARLQAVGIGVHVWTYNDASQLERLAGTSGITGIVTDFPQRLGPILERLRRTGDA